jgi:probable HAF family extracellular repeat protein
MQDLGVLQGDVGSSAGGLNDKGEVVGGSADASGNVRAFLWQNGQMLDLNTLVCGGTSLYLYYGGDINDHGEIVGVALDLSAGTGAP